MRCTTCSCCQSFWPKYAVSGRTWPKSFAQTLLPRENVRGARCFPVFRRSTYDDGRKLPRRIHRDDSPASTGRGPQASSFARSPASSRGYFARVVVWAELQWIDEDRGYRTGAGRAAARSSASCPECSAPIVGTSASAPKRRRSAEQAGPGWARSRKVCMHRSIARQDCSRDALSGRWRCRQTLG